MNTGIVSLPEFICTTLKNNREGGFITSRGYRQSKARGLSARRRRDAVLVERISAVHHANYGVKRPGICCVSFIGLCWG